MYEEDTSDSDNKSDEGDPLWVRLSRNFNVNFLISFIWELDLAKFVTNGSCYFVPVLAIRYGSRTITDMDKCHFRSDPFIDRVARCHITLMEGQCSQRGTESLK